MLQRDIRSLVRIRVTENRARETEPDKKMLSVIQTYIFTIFAQVA